MAIGEARVRDAVRRQVAVIGAEPELEPTNASDAADIETGKAGQRDTTHVVKLERLPRLRDRFVLALPRVAVGHQPLHRALRDLWDTLEPLALIGA